MKAQSTRRKTFMPYFRIYCGDDVALGPGKAELLDHIAETGSISEAARRMEMSYNRAWLLVRTMNRCFKEPLVAATRGGDRRGGAELTETGKQMLAAYRELEARILAAAKPAMEQIKTKLKR